jgi:hypothetical protein
MPLTQKLVKIRESIPYAQKDTKAFKYTYVSGTQILTAIKSTANELGVLITPVLDEPIVTSIQPIHTDAESKSTSYNPFLFFCKGKYVLRDEDETIEIPWAFCGADADPAKAFGKALTYAERYFLLKFLNIPTDDEDPDSYAKKNPGIVAPVPAAVEPKKAETPASKPSKAAPASKLKPVTPAAKPVESPADDTESDSGSMPDAAPETSLEQDAVTEVSTYDFPTFEPDGSCVAEERITGAITAFKKIGIAKESLVSMLGADESQWNEGAMTALSQAYKMCVNNPDAIKELSSYV